MKRKLAVKRRVTAAHKRKASLKLKHAVVLARLKVLGRFVLYLSPVPFFFLGCALSPPRQLDNICDIFEEKSSWYKAAEKSRDRWGAPIPVMMAIMHQESRFQAYARPPRTRILWLLPGPRLSDAYGYSQAKNSTWAWYQDKSGNRGADRDSFADAVDFVGWYNAQSHRVNKIPRGDAYNLYLAYHEGHGGYQRGTFAGKQWLRTTAQRVADRADRYSLQLSSCEEDLQNSGWWPF